jgi:O-antigen/teichoic acid export membrane protein
MSLKKNILANYTSQIYVTLIGIAIVPLYIKYMGAEAYGLVGFFAMLQAWFTLLDMGLTPTMARETARFHGGATDALHYRRLVRALEGVFLIVALVGGGAMFLLSDVIAHEWLKANLLPTSEIARSLNIISVIIAMRWMGGLYRGAINGAEKLVWLSTFNSAIATLRFIGVLPVLILIDSSPSAFFLYQLLVATIELTGLALKAYQLLPVIPNDQRVRWAWAPLKPVLKFSLTIAFTSSVWVLFTQTDKLVLSNILSLADYGYFTLAVLVASGIMIVGGPVSSALMPRMANLEARDKHAELIHLYRQSTQFVAVVAGATATTIALGAESLLYAWTGDTALAKEVAPILSLYAWGNGILVIAAFPYYLQYAKGDLRLHLIGNAVFVVLLIPTIVLVASKYQGVGAGYVWLGMNMLSFFAWLPLVHRKFAPGLNAKWYTQDLFSIMVPIVLVGILVNGFMSRFDNRWYHLTALVLMEIFLLVTGVFASSAMRAKVKITLKKNYTDDVNE